jgi:hypothetical protein
MNEAETRAELIDPKRKVCRKKEKKNNNSDESSV